MAAAEPRALQAGYLPGLWLRRCTVVGIRVHKEFSIDPAHDPVGHFMPEFTKFLRETFSLPRDAPIRLAADDKRKPRMMIISRQHLRKLVNVEDVVRLAERVGFKVVIGDTPFNVDVGEFAGEVNAADVLMGVHGAGLTNSVFLPTGRCSSRWCRR